MYKVERILCPTDFRRRVSAGSFGSNRHRCQAWSRTVYRPRRANYVHFTDRPELRFRGAPASGLTLWRNGKALIRGGSRIARGTAWKSLWCAVNHRRNVMIGRPAPLHGGV